MSYEPGEQLYQDHDILSTRETELRNWQLYDERKNRRQECAEPKCPTLIGYLQDEYCRRHERIADERMRDKKLWPYLKRVRK